MDEERLIDIETRLAHQDHMMFELDKVVTKQQEKIMQLEQLCASILDRVRALGESRDEPRGDERPPHY